MTWHKIHVNFVDSQKKGNKFMFKLKAKESHKEIIKDNYYYIGGLIQNENNVVLMDIKKKYNYWILSMSCFWIFTK
jgi:hypothetical protein